MEVIIKIVVSYRGPDVHMEVIIKILLSLKNPDVHMEVIIKLKCPRCNHMQIMCNTQNTYHVQRVVCLLV